jgi:hypothetical protein
MKTNVVLLNTVDQQNHLTPCILQFKQWLLSFLQSFSDVSNSKKAATDVGCKQQRKISPKATGRITLPARTAFN